MVPEKKKTLPKMGKEWYYWNSGGDGRSSTSKRGAVGGDKDTVNTTTTNTATPSGCMSAVFHFFDFHHFQFPLHHHHHQPSSFKPHSLQLPDEDHTILKGVEAPRNSLELEETPVSSNFKEEDEEEEENLKIPMGIQIKTRNYNNGDHTRSKSRLHGATSSNYDSSSSSEISSSPGAKTPNLVARLMGLDLLPETNSLPSSPSLHEPPTTKPTMQLHHHLRTRQVPSFQNKPIIGHRHSTEVDVRVGTRSLPETPRISSARRSDVDLHHRLSLQINKENAGAGSDQDFEFSRFSYLRRKEIKQEDQYRTSPSQYARQIVKQVRESVSRKVGLDITNTSRNRSDHTLQTREEVLSQLVKTKKITSSCRASDQTSPGKHSTTASSSPRLSRFLEPKQRLITSTPPTTDKNKDHHKIQPRPIRVLSSNSKTKLQAVHEQQQSDHHQRPAKKCKKAAVSERFSTPRVLKKPPKTADVFRNKQEEPFVRPLTANRANYNPDKNSKNTPLSNNLLNSLPFKKDPSPPPTKILQKQVLLSAQSSKRSSSQLSSNSSQLISYKQEATHKLVARDNIDDRSNDVVAATTATAGVCRAAENEEYVTRILKRTGLDKHTPVSFTTWFSPSHPLDPSIFHHLEKNINNSTSDSPCSGQLSLQCNRKLLFELVDEILVDVLKPVMNMKPWCKKNMNGVRGCYGSTIHGSDLIETVCSMVGRFPCADCRVLEDIDALIERDLPTSKLQKASAFEEEGEGVVMEIEKDILESLIHETALEYLGVAAIVF